MVWAIEFKRRLILYVVQILMHCLSLGETATSACDKTPAKPLILRPAPHGTKAAPRMPRAPCRAAIRFVQRHNGDMQ
jgi:hypothetical protein